MDRLTEVRRMVMQAVALQSARRPTEGLELVSRALQLQPSDPFALFQHGRLLEDLLRLDEALHSYDRAILAKPEYAAALGAKAHLLIGLGRLDEAHIALEMAILAKPHFAATRLLKGELLLMRGELAEGWKWFEARLESGTHVPHPITKKVPQWKGETIAGQKLLIHEEFGLGDVLMMARYVPYLEEAGAHVMLAVRSGLIPLLQTSFPHALVVHKRELAPPADAHCPVLSLPYALRDSVREIPSKVPYLDPGSEARARWRARLGPASAPRVGIVWTGAARAIDSSPLRRRSLPLAALEPLLQLPFEFHSLQQEVSGAPLARSKLRQHGEYLSDLLETAALASAMDAVVSIDTSVVHLAGALGLPTHVVLPFASDYRWQRHGRNAWYPQANVFRQPSPGDWPSVVAAVTTSLATLFRIDNAI